MVDRVVIDLGEGADLFDETSVAAAAACGAVRRAVKA